MREITKPQRYLLSILSGVLLFVAFPFTGSMTFLAFVAWIPLFLVENYITVKKYKSRQIYSLALVTFIIYNSGTSWWIWNASAGGAVFAIVLNALIMALVFFIFHRCKKAIAPQSGILFFPILWIAFEFIHYHWELSHPWLTLGNMFSITPQIVQWYSITGVFGGSLWILATNIIGFQIIEQVWIYRKDWQLVRNKLISFTLLLALPISISALMYQNYEEEKKPVELVVVQPNIDPYNEKFDTDVKTQLKKLFQQADQQVTEKTACVIAPETAISMPFYEDELQQMSFYPEIMTHVRNWKNTQLLIGASTAKFYETKNSIASRPVEGGPGFIEYYNSSLIFDQAGNNQIIHKSKLVLGVEKIPFARWIPWLEELSINNGGTSGTLGIEKTPKVIQTPNFSFAPSICYESIYGGLIALQCQKGSDFIFIITNDGWWGDTPGYKQHASFARLRAIENRKSIARSANTGISCFINQRGDVLQATNWWVPAAIKEKLNRNSVKTCYTLFPDLLGKTFAIGSLIILLFWIYKTLSSKIIQKN